MTKLSKEQMLEVYKKVVDQLGYHGEATLHENYSGRFMYCPITGMELYPCNGGANTLGISGDFSEELMYRLFLESVADILDGEKCDRVCYWQAISDVCDIVNDIYPKRQDSLGLGKIYYR